ncbi:PAS domain S-box protein [Polyangium sorediatum]|uniref:PAS domain S-box protein n=1 Tax=Polyangium sorediatum TaxID=889274 RepID=A0ABT6P563_9BACT|nr:PAS domain S-box protein [Polyangium sorediatum]MDI1435760.1 PAS domain S-box protein [Polyangium sorediatum]
MGIEERAAPAHFEDARLLGALTREAPMGIVGLDMKGTIVAWNPEAERIFGYVGVEVIGKTIRDLLGPATDADPGALVSQLDPTSPQSFTAPCVRKDGARFHCEWLFRALRDEKGELLGRAAFIRDTTEETETRATLAAERRFLRRMLDNTPLVLWSTDKNGIFTLSDGAGLRALGFAPGEVVGMSAFEVYRDVPEIVGAIRGALAGTFSTTLAATNGTVWECRYIPITREDGGPVEGVLGVALDVTERVEAERTLRRQLDLIAQQEGAIRTLSTPIARVWEGALALPLVGTIDGARAEQILATLLEAVVREQAHYVILDMTGIGEVDATTADHLFKVLRALGLLGATALVTGVNPGVATALVGLGVDLGSVVTLGNLEEALRYVMKRRAGKPRRAPAPSAHRV